MAKGLLITKPYSAIAKYRAMGWIKAWEQVEGTSPELLKMYADTPNSLRCDGYLDRLAFWGQRESNKHNYL